MFCWCCSSIPCEPQKWNGTIDAHRTGIASHRLHDAAEAPKQQLRAVFRNMSPLLRETRTHGIDATPRQWGRCSWKRNTVLPPGACSTRAPPEGRERSGERSYASASHASVYPAMLSTLAAIHGLHTTTHLPRSDSLHLMLDGYE